MRTTTFLVAMALSCALTAGCGCDGKPPPGPSIEHEGGTIGDETWVDARHVVLGDITVEGTLTVDPCARIEMPLGGLITVQNGGALRLIGTAACPITITSSNAAPAPGDWDEIDFYSSADNLNNEFQYVIVEYAGGSNYGALWLDDGASLAMTNSTVRFSGDVGMLLEGDAELRNFTGNTLINNVLGPIYLSPNHAGDLGVGTYQPNDVEGIQLSSSAVSVDQTWLAHDAPYVAESGFGATVAAGSAHLTVEAGTTIALGDGAAISIRDNGGLTLAGTPTDPVTITSAKSAPAAGDWAYVEIYASSADGNNDFDNVILEYGGGSSYGMLWVETGASVAVTDSTIRYSDDFGIEAEAGSELRDFTGNTLTDNTGGPIQISANDVDTLGAGTYTPNGVEGVIVTSNAVDHDATWLNLGVPYVCSSGFSVEPPAGSAVLTVSAGTTLAFGSGAIATVRNGGALTLAGTAAEHVTVTSSSSAPAAGDWAEIDIYSTSTGPMNLFQYTDISYGGGSTYGQLWLNAGAEVTLEDVTFSDAGMGCDIDNNGGTVNETNATYILCP